MNEFENLLEKRFKIKKSKQVTNFIGVQFNYTNEGIILHQEKLITEAVKKFDLLQAKEKNIPIDLNCLDNSNSPNLKDIKLYQSIVGSLNYLVNCTRADAMFAVNLLSRRAHQPTLADLKRAKNTLVYLRDRKNYGLICKKGFNLKKRQINVYVNSSHANGDQFRSIFGFIIYLDENK